MMYEGLAGIDNNFSHYSLSDLTNTPDDSIVAMVISRKRRDGSVFSSSLVYAVDTTVLVSEGYGDREHSRS